MLTAAPAGLTSAMYLKGGQQVAKPDSESGLYIASRPGTVVKVSIPDDHIAYQVSRATGSGLHSTDAAPWPADILPCSCLGMDAASVLHSSIADPHGLQCVLYHA
jgi:hypothetical protein